MDPRWLALTVLTISRVSLGFQFQSLASVAPLIRQDMGVSYADIGVLIGLYMSPGIVVALPGGMIGGRLGDKRMVCVGLILMVAGAALMGVAESYSMLVIGRLVSGIGGVLLNVLMSKMITDWFADREIVLAMAIFMNSFPIGMGLALLGLGPLAESHGAAAAMHTTAAVALASLLLVLRVYRRHPNDGITGAADRAWMRMPWRELVLVCIAGAIWGLFNGAHSIVAGFAPILLTHMGLNAAAAGFFVGVSTWLVVLSGQVGGIIAHRWAHERALLGGSVLVWGLCLLLLPAGSPEPLLIAAGLAQGLPVGIILTLPAMALRPESRALGMGIFFTWLYVGQAGLPALSGWLQDVYVSPATSLYFAAALVLLILPLLVLFWVLQSRSFVPIRAN